MCNCPGVQGHGVRRSDPAERVQAPSSARQQQGEEGHRSGRQTEAWRHQPGIIQHVREKSETSAWKVSAGLEMSAQDSTLFKWSLSSLSGSRRGCRRRCWESWFHTESWWSSLLEGQFLCVCVSPYRFICEWDPLSCHMSRECLDLCGVTHEISWNTQQTAA